MRAFILAGGKSTRMKYNKAFVKLNNKPLIEIILSELKTIFNDSITVITNEPELYKYLNVDLKVDLVKDKGPLGGIYTGLVESKSFHNFFVPCDMPFVKGEAIEYLIDEKDEYDVIVPFIKGYIEPLCGIYSKNCIKPIEECLSEGKLRVKSFYDRVKVKTIPEEPFKKIDPELKMFININTLDNLEFACKMLFNREVDS